MLHISDFKIGIVLFLVKILFNLKFENTQLKWVQIWNIIVGYWPFIRQLCERNYVVEVISSQRPRLEKGGDYALLEKEEGHPGCGLSFFFIIKSFFSL